MAFTIKFMDIRASVTKVKYNVQPVPQTNRFLYSQHLTQNECGFFPHQPILQLSRYQLRVLQFSYQELAPTLEVKSHKTVPHFECQFQVPVVTCTSVICPMSPSSSLTIFKNSSQKSGKCFIYYYLFITKNVFMYLFELAFSLGYTPRSGIVGSLGTNLKKYMHPNVHSSIIYNF